MLGAQWPYEQERTKVCLQKAAAYGGGSEVEALAAYCGERVIRLCGLRDLIKELPQLGQVRTMTGNQHAVHEQVGQYQTVKLLGSQGRVQGDGLNLRLFLNHWHYGFAVTEKCDDGFRHSLQFFDRDGVGVHKVYLTMNSHRRAYENLIACYRSADQRPRQSVAPVPQAFLWADAEVDVALLRQSWRALQDIQDLPALFRSLGIARMQALRLAGDDLAAPVTLPDLPVLMERLRATGLPWTFHVSNGGMEQIHTGRVRHVETTGLWHAVLGTDFILHLRGIGIAGAWIVRKPGREGALACLELYNRAGENILQIFSPFQPGQAGYEIWRRLLAALEVAPFSVCPLLSTV